MISLPKPKINKATIINICGWIFFLLIVAYEIYFLNDVYMTINPPIHFSTLAHTKKIDQVGLQKALSRFNDSQSYAPAPVSIPDPFAVIVKGVSAQ